jgi:protein required for attachment to host cells
MCICVVVADSSKARFLLAKTGLSPLTDDKGYVQCETRLKEQDIVSDGTESRVDFGEYGKHQTAHEKAPHQEQAKKFANQLCDEIERLRQTSKWFTIYMIAPPTFLSLLRTSLSKKCSGLLGDAVNKDLVNHSIEEIRNHLPRRL